MAKQDQPGAGPAAAAMPRVEPPKKSRGKLLLFVVIPALVLILGGGAAAYFFLLAPKPEAAHDEPPPPPKTYVYYNLPEILVNLNSQNRARASFLKITVSLQLDSEADVQRIQRVMPRIVDGMQAYLRELRADDLVGATKLARVRTELRDRVNGETAPVKVVDVLFLDILLQ
jgi:flagellar FliL protein